MNHPDASRLGLITTVVFIGGFVGFFIAPPSSDYFGRRISMLIGSTTTLCGTILQTAAHNSDMFMAGRFLVGLGISFTCVAGPPLLFELARPSMRAAMTSTFNVLWYLGSIIAAWVTFATGHMSTTWSWRIPSLIQGVTPAIVILAVLCGMPESPRWLYARGKVEEARAILAHYHAHDDLNADVVQQQLNEIQATLGLEKFARAAGVGALFRTKANRKRMTVVVLMALLMLWNGQGVISYYFSPILDSVGIKDTTSQTGINGGLQIWNFLCSIMGVVLASKIGRRPLWLISYVGMICANVPLTVASAMYEKRDSKQAAYVVVVFLSLYDAAFNLANNPLLYSYPTEILPFAIRSRGLGVMIAVSQAALTVNQYVNPIALAHIGFYYYIFYLGMLIFGVVIIYLMFPETKNLSEEELTLLFEDKDDVVLHGLETGEHKTAHALDGLHEKPEFSVEVKTDGPI
ncbi:MFS sugar transporter-like protein [Aureobasidium sp. EXF-10728]|nr:MFS sugar transporter-like protein [Aureobasidium sp. EXF-10728]